MLAPLLTTAALFVLGAAPATDPFALPEIEGPQVVGDPDRGYEVTGPEATVDPDTPGSATLRVLADRVRFTKDEQVVYVEGEVEVHNPPFIVLADALRIDFRRKRIDALGRVRIVERNRLLACNESVVRMTDGQGTLREVRFEIRDQQVPLDRARDLAARGRSWEGSLWVFGTAAEVRRESSGALVLSDAMITPCDCGDGDPSWKLTSGHVDVVTDHGAWARWPVVYVGEVPVMALPLWYIPLSERQSGLLAPRFQLRDGFWLLQPLYLTLGRSADVTLSPGYVLERGPRAEVELRWAPARGSDGYLQLATQWDEKFLSQRGEERLSPLLSRTPSGEVITATRAAVRLLHRTARRRSAGVVDLRVSSDRRVAGDFGETLGARVEPYVRSAAQLHSAFGDNLVAGVHASAYQDLLQEQLRFFPLPGETPYRAPLMFGRLLPTGLGPVVLGADADLVHVGLFGEGAASPRVPDAIRSGWRASLWPRLSWPFALGAALRGDIGAGYRQALFAPETGTTRASGAAVLDAGLRTELSRVYPVEGARWRHGLQPFTRYVGVPLVVGDDRGPAPIVDELDRFRAAHQLMLGLRSTLHRRRGASAVESVLDLTLAQGFDLLPAARWLGGGDASGSLADTVLSTRLAYGGLSGRLLVAIDPVDWRVGTVLSKLRLSFPSGLVLATSYDLIGARPADLLYAANHELFGDTAIPVPGVPIADRLAIGAAYSPIENTRVSYSGELVMVADRPEHVPGVQPTVLDRVLTHGGSVVYHSSCRCWEAGMRVRFWPDRSLPDVGLVLSISGFGEQISIF